MSKDKKMATIRVKPDIRAYVKDDGEYCPYCGSSWVDDDDYADNMKSCGNCAAKWADKTKVIGLTEALPPQNSIDELEEPPAKGSPLYKYSLSQNKRASILQSKIAHLEYRLGKPTAAKVEKVAVKVLTAGKFDLGRVVNTRGIHSAAQKNPRFKLELANSFRKYMRGDWGISKDKRMNDRAVKNGDDRIMGVYDTSEGDIWIITEWDRSATTVLFPNEY